MSLHAMHWLSRFNPQLLLNNIEHVATVTITPMSNQLQLLGVFFHELFKQAGRCLLALNIVKALLFILTLIHLSNPVGACKNTGYTAMCVGDD